VKPVDQDRFAKRCDKCPGFHANGNCASAVIASILELPLSEVPYFVEAKHGWWPWLEEWLERRGYEIEVVARENLPPGPVYASGTSPRGFSHAVVWEGGPNGRVVHDPHFTRAGLAGDPTMFAVIRPAKERCIGCGRGRDEPRQA
jgi:hypothetical protein